MQIKFEKNSGKTTIKLTWLETKQFLHTPEAVEQVRETVKETIALTDDKNGVKTAIITLPNSAKGGA